MKRTKQSGFTLVEILIVVIILGILAAIIIPQFTDASTEAKNSTLRSNIQSLQSQFELYKTQHNDNYPWDTDATAAVSAAIDSSANILEKLVNKTDVNGVTEADGGAAPFFGPYMQRVPANPFTTTADANGNGIFAGGAATAGDDTSDWYINTDTGAIYGYPNP